MTSLDSLRRYWKKKQYQRLDDTADKKRELKLARAGSRRQQVEIVNEASKVMLKLISTVKFLCRFLKGKIVSLSNNDDKKISQNISDKPRNEVHSNEVVDARSVLEIFNSLVSSAEGARLLACSSLAIFV
ncbi:hypothetical protein DCAR_0727099 [Daucus carota subsp. sativus]|uniref:Uncharacterized protein n=1 Tax=Daucus carota subsp. sativus TaxID=79200 RepID=A0A161X2D3_DAUCS|nr:hypothetical protein DCAR_0727099 [Daucus carota subsp. sativus]